LKDAGHRVGRSTIARGGADLFTTEVWTWRGLVTFYTAFVIDLAAACRSWGRRAIPTRC
jgi:hypothetical protein